MRFLPFGCCPVISNVEFKIEPFSWSFAVSEKRNRNSEKWEVEHELPANWHRHRQSRGRGWFEVNSTTTGTYKRELLPWCRKMFEILTTNCIGKYAKKNNIIVVGRRRRRTRMLLSVWCHNSYVICKSENEFDLERKRKCLEINRNKQSCVCVGSKENESENENDGSGLVVQRWVAIHRLVRNYANLPRYSLKSRENLSSSGWYVE